MELYTMTSNPTTAQQPIQGTVIYSTTFCPYKLFLKIKIIRKLLLTHYKITKECIDDFCI